MGSVGANAIVEGKEKLARMAMATAESRTKGRALRVDDIDSLLRHERPHGSGIDVPASIMVEKRTARMENYYCPHE